MPISPSSRRRVSHVNISSLSSSPLKDKESELAKRDEMKGTLNHWRRLPGPLSLLPQDLTIQNFKSKGGHYHHFLDTAANENIYGLSQLEDNGTSISNNGFKDRARVGNASANDDDSMYCGSQYENREHVIEGHEKGKDKRVRKLLNLQYSEKMYFRRFPWLSMCRDLDIGVLTVNEKRNSNFPKEIMEEISQKSIFEKDLDISYTDKNRSQQSRIRNEGGRKRRKKLLKRKKIVKIRSKHENGTLQVKDMNLEDCLSEFPLATLIGCSIANIHLGLSDFRVPRLACVVTDIRYLPDGSTLIKMIDPSGRIDGYIHESILEEHGSDFGIGCVLLLTSVGICVPFMGVKRILNITSSNVVCLYPANDDEGDEIHEEELQEVIEIEESDSMSEGEEMKSGMTTDVIFINKENFHEDTTTTKENEKRKATKEYDMLDFNQNNKNNDKDTHALKIRKEKEQVGKENENSIGNKISRQYNLQASEETDKSDMLLAMELDLLESQISSQGNEETKYKDKDIDLFRDATSQQKETKGPNSNSDSSTFLLKNHPDIDIDENVFDKTLLEDEDLW